MHHTMHVVPHWCQCTMNSSFGGGVTIIRDTLRPRKARGCHDDVGRTDLKHPGEMMQYIPSDLKPSNGWIRVGCQLWCWCRATDLHCPLMLCSLELLGCHVVCLWRFDRREKFVWYCGKTWDTNTKKNTKKSAVLHLCTSAWQNYRRRKCRGREGTRGKGVR